jgi:hypothetical protein
MPDHRDARCGLSRSLSYSVFTSTDSRVRQAGAAAQHETHSGLAPTRAGSGDRRQQNGDAAQDKPDAACASEKTPARKDLFQEHK